MYNPEQITYFGETDYRNKRIRFGIKAKDRTRHMYVIGKTGMGKSTMLENMAVQDLQNGNGIAFLDPHGGSAETLLDYVPQHRIKDVLYFAPFDTDNPISFNVMEDVGYDKRYLVVAGLMSVFEKIWADAWSARMSYILQNTLLALLEYPDTTLLDINRMLVNKEFRKKVVDYVQDPAVRSFWLDEFATYTDRYTQEATPAIQNKIGQFASNPLIRNIIGQPKSSFDVREFMDERKIMIINLSKGQIGEGNTNLLGSMLITKIYLSAMSRADLSADELKRRPNFYFYVDEFQSFANKSFADILSEARKYKLNLTIAHQYVEQMEEEVRSAVFGNVGTMAVFRVGSYDAELFEREFAPEFTAEDIVNLGFAQMYLKLMIDGIGSRPFSASSLPPVAGAEQSFREDVLESSRKQFSCTRAEVEQRVRERLEDAPRLQEQEDKKKRDAEKARGTYAPTSSEGRNNQHRESTLSHGDEEEKRLRSKKKAPVRNVNQEESVSLAKLSSGKDARNTQNRHQLRDALADILKEAQDTKEESAGKNGTSSAHTNAKENDGEEANQKQNTSMKEVPEEELRKILK